MDNKNKQLNVLISEKEEECKRVGKISESEQKYLDGLKEQLRDLHFLEEYKPVPAKDTKKFASDNGNLRIYGVIRCRWMSGQMRSCYIIWINCKMHCI